jgi:hypothetical protein
VREMDAHPGTPIRTVALKQVSVIWRAGSVWMLIGTCVALAIYMRREMSLEMVAQARGDYSRFGAVYDLLGYLLILGAIWPLVVWRGEPWGERDYRWSLPVSRHSHDLIRVAAGAVWLMLGVAVCLAVIRISQDVIVPAFPMVLVDPAGLPAGTDVLSLAGRRSLQAGGYLNFFTAPLLSYTIISIVALSTRRPLGIAVVIGLAIATWSGIGQMFRHRWMAEVLEWPIRGLYGLEIAFNGLIFDVTRVRVVSGSGYMREFQYVQLGTVEWMTTFALWFTLAGALLFIASRRRA